MPEDAAISGIDDASQVRVRLLQSGRGVHVPLSGLGFEPGNANLTSWAAITRAAGFDAFVATPSSANLATLVTNETGSGALVFGTSPTIATPVLTLKQSAAPTPTAEGAIEWDTDDDVLRIGNGATATQVGVAMGTLQATTSGTTKTFTFPAGTKRITVSLAGVSTNGTNNLAMLLGDAGGTETAGYASTNARLVAAPTFVTSTSAFILVSSVAAANGYSGAITLTLLNPATFLWCITGSLAIDGGNGINITAGQKALSAELTQFEINAGGNTFDAGSINVMYE